MLRDAEIDEIFRTGEIDGYRLYNVSETIYKVLIVFNWVIGIVGGLVSIGVMSKVGFIAGVLALVATAFVCGFLYASAVLSTHIAKVLVHILFANLAIITIQKK